MKYLIIFKLKLTFYIFQTKIIKVQYSKGLARIIDFTDQPSLDINSIKNCLKTKWPTIEIKWEETKPPSLN